MGITQDSILFIACLLTGSLGMFVSLILFFVNKEKSLAPNLVAMIIAILSYIMLVNAAYVTNYFIIFPLFYRLMAWTIFCIGPLSYLYVRSVLEQTFRLKRTDWLFFIPVPIYLIHRIPFYLLSSEQKVAVIKHNLTNLKLILLEPEGLFPKGWVAVARILLGVIFLAAQCRLIWKWKAKINKQKQFNVHNQTVFTWLQSFTYILSISYLLVFIEMTLHVSNVFRLDYLILTNVGLTILFICVYLVVKPEILYGMKGWLQESPVKTEEAVAQPVESIIPSVPNAEQLTKKKSIPHADAVLYESMIEQYFSEKQPFIKTGYSIKDLSNEIQLPSYILSAFINQYLGKNFNEFINDLRIDHLCDQVQKDDSLLSYTIEALGNRVGFNSRTTFINAFKKRKGMTPSEYFNLSKKQTTDQNNNFSYFQDNTLVLPLKNVLPNDMSVS